MKAKQDAQRAHLQKFIDRFRAKASKARQAQSRIKQLEKMQDIAVPLEERTIPFQFEDPVGAGLAARGAGRMRSGLCRRQAGAEARVAASRS